MQKSATSRSPLIPTYLHFASRVIVALLDRSTVGRLRLAAMTSCPRCRRCCHSGTSRGALSADRMIPLRILPPQAAPEGALMPPLSFGAHTRAQLQDPRGRLLAAIWGQPSPRFCQGEHYAKARARFGQELRASLATLAKRTEKGARARRPRHVYVERVPEQCALRRRRQHLCRRMSVPTLGKQTSSGGVVAKAGSIGSTESTVERLNVINLVRST